MNKGKWFWAIGAVLAFASVISFFQINSYFADQHKLNTVWLVAGIICGLGALVLAYKAYNIQDY